MKELTEQQALDFSIKKWEAIVEKEGEVLSLEEERELGISNFTGSCGLCAKYYTSNCSICPFNKSFINGCSYINHPWRDWGYSRTKENAQIVLDELKALKE